MPNTTSATAAAQDNMLFKLSGELRNIIYDYVFSDQVYEIRVATPVRTWNRFAQLLREREPNVHPKKDVEYLPLEGPASATVPKNALSLLLTCREIYEETRLLPFRLPTFTAQKICDIKQFNSRMTGSRIQLISSLEIRLPNKDYNTRLQIRNRWGPFYAAPKPLAFIKIHTGDADTFRSMIGLKHLHVHQLAWEKPWDDFSMYLGRAQIAINILMFWMPEVELTCDLEAISSEAEKKWILSLGTARELSWEERRDVDQVAIKALCEVKED
jgi:hypothetical protein